MLPRLRCGQRERVYGDLELARFGQVQQIKMIVANFLQIGH
jgi:hypothetical protein